MKYQTLVLEQIDPESNVASGIDSIIRDFVKYGSGSFGFVIAGVSATRRPGRWCTVDIGGHPTPFLPLATVDRTRREPFPRRYVPHSLRLAWGLLRYRRRLRDADIRLVHAHRLELGVVARRILRRPVVQFVHNARASLTGSASDSAWSSLAPLYAVMERSSMDSAAAVGVFSRVEAARISELRADVVRCLTWYDPELFHTRDAAGSEGLSVVWVGRLESQKDPLLALEAFAALLQHRPNATLHVAGDGSLALAMREQIRSLPPGSVEMLGSQSRTQVAELLRRCSVFLMTSHYEGSPTVLVEAAACGLPMVVTEGADPDLVIEEEATGFRVARDSDLLAGALLKASSLDRERCADSVQDRAAPGLPSRLLADLHDHLGLT